MIILTSLVVGALIGALTARRRGGNGLDMAQYAGVGAILGVILGAGGTIALERLLF